MGIETADDTTAFKASDVVPEDWDIDDLCEVGGDTKSANVHDRGGGDENGA